MTATVVEMNHVRSWGRGPLPARVRRRGPRGQLPYGRHGLARDVVVADQRARLMRAAVRVTADHGRAGATVARVLRAAGVSQKTLYQHFGGINEVLLCACEEAVERLLDSVESAVTVEPTWESGIRQGVGVLLDDLAAQPEVARCLFLELCPLGAPAEQLRPRALARLARLLAPPATDGSVARSPTVREQLAAGGVWQAIETAVLSGDVAVLPSFLPVLHLHVLACAGRPAKRDGSARPADHGRVRV